MPARGVTIGIRDEAQRQIAEAAAVLAERFGIEPPVNRGFDGRDRDYLAARELEALGAFLAGLAAAPNPQAAELEYLSGKLASKAALAEALGDELKRTREQAEADIAGLAAVNGLWAAFGEATQALLNRAVEDEPLRTALIKAGYIQAEFGETTGWSISVVGIGPDLTAMIDASKPVTGDAAEQLAGETEPPAGQPEPVPPIDLEATVEMSFAELKEAAAQLGVEDADKLRSKQAAIDAIRAKAAELDATADPAAAPEQPQP